MELIDIDLLIDAGISVNETDNKEIAFLTKSVKKYGQLRPIIIDKHKRIIDGHKLYSILKKLNVKQCYVIVLDLPINEKQIHIELNIDKPNLNPIKVFKSLKYDFDLKNHILPYPESDIFDFIELLNLPSYIKNKDMDDIF